MELLLANGKQVLTARDAVGILVGRSGTDRWCFLVLGAAALAGAVALMDQGLDRGAALCACLLGTCLLALRVVARARALAVRLGAVSSGLATTMSEAVSLRAAIDGQSILSVTDLRGRILEVNDRFCEISGYSREELIGSDHRIVNSGHHPPGFWRGMWAALQSGRAWAADVCNRAKDGSLYWVHSVVAPVRDARGLVTRYVSIRTDITARVHALERLRDQEALLEQAQLLAKVGSWSFDHKERCYQWSKAIAAILELDAGRLGGSHDALLEVVHREDRERVREALEGTLVRPVPWAMAHRLLMGDGRIKHVQARCETTWDAAGCSLRSLGTLQDVTELRQVEEQLILAREEAEVASRAKGEFLANMSHEIRTPLTAILGYAELLGDGGEPASAGLSRAEMTAAMRAAGEHLLTVINDILDLSKIEAGRLAFEPVELDLPGLLTEVLSVLRPRCAGKPVELSLELSSAIPSRVHADPTRLRQILFNLTGNALKFTDAGKVRLEASAEPLGGQVRLRFVVTDTGVGMSPEQAAQLFRSFTQVHNRARRRFAGTGLGLAISQRLALAMGGEVRLAQSAPGQGSTFLAVVTVGLPADATWGRSLHPPSGPSETRQIRLAGKVLLAEDGADNRRLIGLVLRRAGASVDIAENGREAFRLLRHAAASGHPYELLVTDVEMPEMDGHELARRIRGAGMTIPILALTAHAMPQDRERCLAAGCDDYATKPVRRPEFLEACQRLVARSAPAAPGEPTGSLQTLDGG